MKHHNIRTASGRFQRMREQLWDGSKWDDGFVASKGQMYVYRPDYPNQRGDGYAPRHRVVYWLQTRDSCTGLDIHHINGNNSDDQFNNLQSIAHGAHSAFHGKERRRAEAVSLTCKECGKQFQISRSRMKSGRGKFCGQPCYQRWKLRPEQRIAHGIRIRNKYISNPGYRDAVRRSLTIARASRAARR